jgi:hypothetical protein
MRKLLALSFAAALVLAYTLPAQAAGNYLGAPDFNFRGQSWQWGTTQDNTSDFQSDFHDARRFVRQRWRLWHDTNFEGKYGWTLGLEWNWVWGSVGGGNAPGGGPDGDDLTDNTRVKNAYVWGMVPHTPVKVSVGLGVEKGLDPHNLMFASNDFFGVRVDIPLIKGMLNTSIGWLKDSEGNDPGFGLGGDTDDDDGDYYFLEVTGALAKWMKAGTYHVWAHARGDDPDDGLIGPLGARTGGNVLLGRPAFQFGDADLYWHGLYVNLKFWQFDFWAQGSYFWGNVDNETVANPEPDGAFAFVGSFYWQPGPFSIGVRGWYFEGDDDPTDNEYTRWAGPDSFFAPLELFYSGYHSWGTGLTGFESAPGGTAFVGLAADWQATKKLKFDFITGPLWWTESEDDIPFTKALNNAVTGDDDSYIAGRSMWKPST